MRVIWLRHRGIFLGQALIQADLHLAYLTGQGPIEQQAASQINVTYVTRRTNSPFTDWRALPLQIDGQDAIGRPTNEMLWNRLNLRCDTRLGCSNTQEAAFKHGILL
jgi:hypothetical protein